MITHVDCLKSTNGYLSTNDDDYFLNEIINQVTSQLNKAINYDYLIIDDLTIAYLLTNKKDYRKLYEFIFKIKNNNLNMNIILCMQSFVEDTNLSFLIKDFAYLADIYFKIDQLSTGYSKEIHGQVLSDSKLLF